MRLLDYLDRGTLSPFPAEPEHTQPQPIVENVETPFDISRHHLSSDVLFLTKFSDLRVFSFAFALVCQLPFCCKGRV